MFYFFFLPQIPQTMKAKLDKPAIYSGLTEIMRLLYFVLNTWAPFEYPSCPKDHGTLKMVAMYDLTMFGSTYTFSKMNLDELQGTNLEASLF